MTNSDSDLSRLATELPLSGIRKFFDLASTMEDVVSLGVGEPDFLTPWVGRENAVYSIERGYTTYTANQGLLELRQAISRRYQELYGIDFNPEEEILITVGVSQGLDLACRALLNFGEQVLIPEPCFVAYKPIVQLAGGIPVSVPTSIEEDFQFSIEQLEKLCTDKTKAILIGNPSNPTGFGLTESLSKALVDFANKKNLFIISDEIYDQLSYEGEHIPICSLSNAKDRTITLNGFSKTYAMTGWRLGYALAPKHVIEVMTRIHSHTMMCAPTPSQNAAISVLRSGDSYVQDMKNQYMQRRNFIVEALNRLGLQCKLPTGAFYAFPSVKSTGLTSSSFAEKLLLEKAVAVVPGDVFGPSGEGHIRCSYATSIEKIELAVNRIESFLETL